MSEEASEDKQPRLTDCPADVQLDSVELRLKGSISNYTQEKITGILEEVQKFTDVEKLFLYLQLPSSPNNGIEDDAGLVVSSMQAHAFEWIHAHLEECDETALPKRQVYNEYQVHCENRGYRELAASDFGKLMKGVFPSITSRRLGTRGQSLYCYGGLKIKNLVHNPFLPQLDIDEKGNAMTSIKQLISSASPVHTSDIQRLNASQQSRHLLQRRKLQQQQLNKQHYLQQQQAQQKPKALKSDGVTSPHADRGGKQCFIPILPKLFAPGTGGSLQIAPRTMLLAGSNHIMPFVGAIGCNRVDLSTISIAKEPSEAAAVADGSSAERSPIRILDTGPKLGVVSLKNGGVCRLASDSQNRGHSQTQGKSPSEWHKVVRGKEAMSLGPGAENNRQAQIKCEHGDGSKPQRCSEVADNTAGLWGTGNVLLSSSFPDNSEQSTSPENIGLIQEMNKSVGLSSHVNGAIFNDGDVKLGDVMGIVTDTVPSGEQVCCPNRHSQIFPNSSLQVMHTTRTSLPTATTLTTVQANHFGKTSTAVTKNSVTSPESLVHTHVPKSLLMNQPSSFPRSPPKSYRIDSDGKLIMLLDDFYYGQLEGNPQLMKEKVNVRSLPFRCNSCEKVLKTNIRFMNHMQHHMDLERWSTESLDIHTMCKHCFRYFATPYHLQCHVKSAHAIELSAITTRCKICELNYDSEQLLLQHMKDHHKPGEMPYACEVCGFRSSYYTDVDAHFRMVHKNTKNLQCPFCLKVLYAGSDFQFHHMQHQKSSVHHCSNCRLNFLNLSSKEQHKAMDHLTHKKPVILEGLQPGTKVILRVSLFNRRQSRFAMEMSPVDACAVRQLSKSQLRKMIWKRLKNTNTCIECTMEVKNFANHFPTYVHCSVCRYSTSCSRSFAEHMINAHTTRQPKYLMYKPFCWKACDMIAKCSCGLQQSWLSFDSMASHLAMNPNHNSKTCSLSDDTELSNGEAVAASTKRKIQSTTITEDEKASKESKHNVKELCIMQNNQNLPTKPVKVENAVERKCDVLTEGASTSIYDDIVMVELGSDNEMEMLLDKPNKMSSWKWIKSTNPPKTPGLLNPQYCETQEVPETIQAANDAVDTFMGQKTRKRKRGDYNTYDDKLRANIAQSALEIGVACTVKKFQKQLGRPINESTVRGLRAAYLKKKKENPEKTIKSLPKKPRGSPLLLGGKYDDMLKDWMKQVRLNGGVINRSIVMAVAEGILLKHDKTKLSQYGGTLQITEAWARSLLTRLGFSKRKGTKDVKKLPQDFPDIQAEFVKRVSDVVKEYKIPDDLIINWDQTGICMVPGGDWTVKKRGSHQGTISDIDDKCKLTVLLAVSKVGTMLPPQLIYTGKTDRCHPKINFPAGWDVTHTKSHCGTDEFMLRYVDKIIIPYAKKTRKDLKLPPTQKCLTIFDFFKVHEGEDLLTKLRRNNIFAVFIPACCTERLQPLDLSVNKEYKDELKRCFHSWYASQVMSLLGEVTGKRNQQVVVNMKTAILKPIHACWLIKCHEEIGKRRELIKAGFVKAGL